MRSNRGRHHPYGYTEEEHNRQLNAVLTRTEEIGLKLNQAKCHFKQKEVKYFGQSISAVGASSDRDKVKAITEMPPPTSVTELRTPCGMFNYLSKFVLIKATMLRPVIDLMKKVCA